MVRVHEIHDNIHAQDPRASVLTNSDDSDFTDASDDEYLLNEQSKTSLIGFGDHDDDDRHSVCSIENESIVDRVKALKYMIPYDVRVYLFSLFTRSRALVINFLYFSRKFAWVSITSTFLLGFPLYYEYQREQQLKFSDLNMSFSPAATSPI
ncbi:mitochondrial import receptor subunit Tom22 [Mitosporidium daphniae]|uniref:Mitochondrial import receptor subunit Tom22 n=1 Tax=Mitosporidium daphniae TaxID=1485682 RepID=A0A098VTF6_9MICR|nr:uncharacterized protein DI09_198p20 [Mitosporidium daphniae]KGG52262.1 hypothetical protein DI09_198p20 [Mitosporidium daphniae]|eukprot:XP_013238698.1 uncharacterized protein DI09_198p20 [Mitosporidium daphniae]